MYHRENDQEDFLVLAGEALAIVEGQERQLRRWDLVHCPAGTNERDRRRRRWPVRACSRSAPATARRARTGAPTPWTKRRSATAPGSSARHRCEGGYAKFERGGLTGYREGWSCPTSSRKTKGPREAPSNSHPAPGRFRPPRRPAGLRTCVRPPVARRGFDLLAPRAWQEPQTTSRASRRARAALDESCARCMVSSAARSARLAG